LSSSTARASELLDRISYSSWMAFRTGCHHRFFLDQVEGHRQNVYGVHLDFGTAIHAAIEKHKTRKDPCTVEEACSLFAQRFTELWGKNHDRYEKKDQELNPADFIRSGNFILQHFHECKELAEAEVVYNEHKLNIPIERTDGLTLNFKGYIDMVIKTKGKRGETLLYIVDFKSCSWGWPKEKWQDRNLQFQLFLYKHFLCKKFNLEPEQVRCAFVLLKKKPRKDDCPVQFAPVSAGPVSVQRALDALSSDLTDIKARLESNSWKKDRSQCINSFGQRCPYLETDHCPGALNS
jgi:hypothetical protein